MLVPAVAICASIDDCAPVPSATIVMTAATPMIMPSIVSAVRILLRLSAFSAMRKIIRIDMSDSSGLYQLRRGQRRELVLRETPLRDRDVLDDLAVAEGHDARAVLGDIHFVRDQQH